MFKTVTITLFLTLSILSVLAGLYSIYFQGLGGRISTMRSDPQVVLQSIVSDVVEKCIHDTNISGSSPPSQMLQEAKVNAEYMFQEFRKVIPEKCLDGYGSHCWRESYSVQWDDSNYTGHIGSFSFSGMMKDMGIRDKKALYFLKKGVHHKYQTDLVCLPKVFLIGYFKCGSSFVYKLIHKLISLSLSESLKSLPLKLTSMKKEPVFWVEPFSSDSMLHYTMPTASSLGRYLFYFFPGMDQVSQGDRKEVILIDGKINKIFKWPRFQDNHFNLSNYCLLPAVLPTLFPGSKFMVIMKNPIKYLYSVFWNSCTRNRVNTIPMDLQLKGPELFHTRATTKIHLFNDCMRDNTLPSISQPCELASGHNYSSCILQRIHLLDKCAQGINFNLHFPGEPMKCGRARIFSALFFVHARKWLTIVSKEHIHFMFLEDWIENLTESARDVLQFLSLDTSITARPELIKEAADSCGQNSQNKIDYKNNPKLHMRRDTSEMLQLFFEPFNMLLTQLIGKNLPFK